LNLIYKGGDKKIEDYGNHYIYSKSVAGPGQRTPAPVLETWLLRADLPTEPGTIVNWSCRVPEPRLTQNQNKTPSMDWVFYFGCPNRIELEPYLVGAKSVEEAF